MQWSLRSSRNTSQTSDEHSTNSKGMQRRGSIDTGILAVLNEVRLGELVGALKKKEFSATRKWIVTNLDNDPNAILRTVYDSLYDSLYLLAYLKQF